MLSDVFLTASTLSFVTDPVATSNKMALRNIAPLLCNNSLITFPLTELSSVKITS
jgi:hypothetical protein